jgi:hypothetical protein
MGEDVCAALDVDLLRSLNIVIRFYNIMLRYIEVEDSCGAGITYISSTPPYS